MHTYHPWPGHVLYRLDDGVAHADSAAALALHLREHTDDWIEEGADAIQVLDVLLMREVDVAEGANAAKGSLQQKEALDHL
jgi:hypothetical protein